MDNEIKTWLFDVLQSIEEIESYFSDIPKIFENYKKDIKTKRADERNIEIIGEAINLILKTDRSFMFDNAQKIIGTEIELPMVTIKFQTI